MESAPGHARWAQVITVAIAISGVLSMHGLEAAFVHDSHAGPTGHSTTFAVSIVESHIAHGGCDLDAPEPPPIPTLGVCVIASLSAWTPPAASGGGTLLAVLANRGLLTAISILRL